MLYGINKSAITKLQSIQNRAARIVLDIPPRTSVTDDIFDNLHWLRLDQRIIFKILLLTHKCFMNVAPAYFSDKLFIIDCEERLLNIIYLHTKSGRRSFSFCAPRYWNCLPKEIRLLNHTSIFRAAIKTTVCCLDTKITLYKLHNARLYSAYC